MYDGQGTLPPKENYFGLLATNGTKKESYNIVWEISKK
jgi:hypothetical protein